MRQNIIIKFRLTTGLLLAFSLLAGCSGIKTYPNTQDKNLHIETKTDPNTLFSKVRAEVDIYDAKNNCIGKYLGTVKLKKAKVDIGIPMDSTSYLAFVFASSSWGTKSTITSETALTPHNGHEYNIGVSYIDDIYSVTINEKNKRKGSSREIDRQRLSYCES
jgi:hypothetical protein